MHKRGHGRYVLTEAWLHTGTVDASEQHLL